MNARGHIEWLTKFEYFGTNSYAVLIEVLFLLFYVLRIRIRLQTWAVLKITINICLYVELKDLHPRIFSGSGSKSLNSGSSLSSGFGDQSDFKGIRLQEAKHISLRKKQSTEVATDSEVKVSTDSEANSKENLEPNTKSEENVQDSCNSPKKENRTEPEVLYPSQNDPGEDPEGRQTSLVYTQALNYIRKIKERSAEQDNYGTTFFCRLRKYHGLKKTGFGVRNKKTLYKACKIIFKSQDAARFTESLNADIVHLSLIIAEIIPIESAYKDGEELSTLGSFSIRHSASCNFSEYDPEAIPYLGHLPQDLTGNSIFECYHPEDMKKLKKIYEEIVHHQGKPYRSEPYRFRTFNNSWVTLMTEWLCFVNPWTKRIESIIGQHRVLKPPKDTDVFLDPTDKNLSPLPEEILIEAQTAQNEILELLTKPVTSYQDPSKEPMVKRRRTLADIMSPFVEELDNIEKKNSNDGAQPCHQVPYSSTKKSVGVSLVSDNLQNSGTPVHKSGAWHCQSGSHSQSQSGSGSGSGDNNCDSNSFRKSGNLKIKFAKDEGNSEAFSNEDRPYMLPLTEEILLKHNQNMQKHFMESQRKNERIISTTKYNNKVEMLPQCAVALILKSLCNQLDF
ncbi:Period circadian protein [Armadillidium vulgare]|nr:Period circadian protein [Armadillidium vulgare]